MNQRLQVWTCRDCRNPRLLGRVYSVRGGKPSCLLFIDFGISGEKGDLKGTEIGVLPLSEFLFYLQIALDLSAFLIGFEM